jgi:hypothetical protein
MIFILMFESKFRCTTGNSPLTIVVESCGVLDGCSQARNQVPHQKLPIH